MTYPEGVATIDVLLDDMDEILDSEGYLPLYQMSWCVRGMRRGLTEEQIAVLCQRAYDEFTSTRSLHLEWFVWPATDLSRGLRAKPGTPLDFDINTTGEIGRTYLALVPD